MRGPGHGYLCSKYPVRHFLQTSLNRLYSSGVARAWVMPGPSSWSLPVERCAVVISPREAQKIFFAFIFQLPGWALVAPSCFVQMYEDLCSIRLTCT